MKYFIKILIFFTFCFSSVYAQLDSLPVKISLSYSEDKLFDSLNFNIFPKKLKKGKVALVLSGGGARGVAQIGVIEVLQKYNVEIDFIVGTSIGAITGGLYSSGYSPDELKKLTKSIDWKNKLSLSNKYDREFLFIDKKKTQDKGFITLSFDGFTPQLPTSLSSGQQLTSLFNIYLLNARYKPKKDFSSLKIPFYAVATDFDKGEKVVLNDGSLIEAIKSSFTFPLLYSPTDVNGRNLVDGGLTANVPVTTARDLGAEYIITVNSTSLLKNTEELKNPINNADQVLSITMAQLNKEQLKNSDIVLTPEIGEKKATDFSNIDLLIKSGEIECERRISEILRKIDTLEEKYSSNYNNFLFSSSVDISSLNISDSLKSLILTEQSNNFVRYVTIEKRLKDIFRTGNFQDVWVDIEREGTRNKIIYRGKYNQRLSGIIISYNNKKDILYYASHTTVKDSVKYNEYKFEQIKKENSSLGIIHKLLQSNIESFGKDNIGKIANRNDYFKFYETLLGKLRDENYSLIDIVKFKLNESSNVLEIEFSDGIVDAIEIKNSGKTKNSIILSEVQIPSDAPLKKEMLSESLGGIYGTNLFKQVSLNFKPLKNISDNKNILEIRVVEKSSRNLKISFRADNERKFQFYTSIANENIFGSGNEFGLFLKGGLRDRDARIELKSYRFFGSLVTYNFSLFINSRDIYNYRQIVDANDLTLTRINEGEHRDIRYGASFLLGTQVEKFGAVYAQVGYENLSRKIINGTTPFENDLKSFKLKLGGKIDSEDKYPFATSGTVFNYSYETARNQLSGGVSYTRISFELSHNISLNRNSVLKPKFVFGFADKTTPDYDFFSLGGENSFYGMLEDEIRGRQILLASIEYRHLLPIQIFFDTYLSVRYDLGQVWKNAEDIQFKDLMHGLGLALLFDTPLGKASFSSGRSFIINQGFTKKSLIWGDYTFNFSIGYDL